MSRRDDSVLLNDMFVAAKQATKAAAAKGQGDLYEDPVWALGLVKCIEIIGEASSRLSAQLREKHPEVSWPAIMSMRNRMVHAYSDIKYEVVWSTITQELPPFVQAIEKILSAEGGSPTDA
ncbi:DUF86 domain-containing protein [bacterium]|nr:DUF86 domain-containing protein [bacterium]